MSTTITKLWALATDCTVGHARLDPLIGTIPCLRAFHARYFIDSLYLYVFRLRCFLLYSFLGTQLLPNFFEMVVLMVHPGPFFPIFCSLSKFCCFTCLTRCLFSSRGVIVSWWCFWSMFKPTPDFHHHHHRHDASARGVVHRLCVAVRGICVAVVVVDAKTSKPISNPWNVGRKAVARDVARIGPTGLHRCVQSHASETTCVCYIQPRRVCFRGGRCCRSDSKRKKCHRSALATCTTKPCVQLVDVDPRWDMGHLALVAACQGSGVASFT